MLPNWQLLNITQTQEDVILAVNMLELKFSVQGRCNMFLLLILGAFREENCRSGDSNPDILADTSS